MSDELPQGVKDAVDRRLAKPDGEEWAKKVRERAEQSEVSPEDD